MASARKHNKFACYLHFDRMTRHSPASRRYIELAIGHLPALQTDLHHAQPLEQRHVLVMSQAHPAAPEELTFQILTNLKFVLVEYERNDSLVFERALVDRGAPARIKLSLPQFMSAAHFVSRSDSIWLALTTIATSVVESYPLTPMESSCAIENSSICISWHNGYRNDSARK
nr:LysR substrate-binding domain-containing protein [Burkholderia cepacia]